MKIFRSIEEYKGTEKTVVALGNFDGVHIGHIEIIRNAVRQAEAAGAVPVCYTFSNHPRNMHIDIAAGEEPVVKLIASEEDKLQLICDLGVEVCLSVPFDEEIMNTPAEAFVSGILHDKLNAAGVCCGFNYRFGARAAGDVALLREEGKRYGMQVFAHDPVTIGGEVVSSTATRRLIRDGNMELCAEYLGRPYSLKGTVITGNEIGRKIGFPTANFEAGHIMMLPPNGVYFSTTTVDGTTYPSISNVGTKPTIGVNVKSVETNLLDFSGNLYGKEIRVALLHHSRPEYRFRDIEALEAQIASDVSDARIFHGI